MGQDHGDIMMSLGIMTSHMPWGVLLGGGLPTNTDRKWAEGVLTKMDSRKTHKTQETITGRLQMGTKDLRQIGSEFNGEFVNRR